MAIKHYIDKKDKTVYVFAEGELSIEDLIAQEKKVIKDKDFEKGYDTFADFSKVKPSPNVNVDKIKMSVDFVESLHESRGKYKLALFAPYEFAYSLCKLYAQFSENILHVNTKVFKEEAEAKRWLKS